MRSNYQRILNIGFVLIFISAPFMTLPLLANTNELEIKLEAAERIEKPAIMNELSKAYLGSDLALAQEWAQKADLLAHQLGQTEQQALAKKIRGTVALLKRQLDEALVFYQDAFDLFEALNDRHEMGNVLNNTGLVFQDLFRLDDALDYHLRALQIREQIGDSEGIIMSSTNIGNTYADLGNAEKAHSYYAKALDINRLLNPNRVSPQLVLLFATNESARGKMVEAETHFEEAVQLALQQEDYRVLINAFNNYGNYYSKLADYGQAIHKLNNALETARVYGGEMQVAAISLNIGTIYEKTKQYETAISFYQNANTLYAKNNLFDGSIRANNNIGLAYKKMALQDSASRYFLKSLNMAKQLQSPFYMALTFNTYGSHKRDMDQYDSAFYYVREAYHFAKKYHVESELARASHNLGLLMFQKGDYISARQYLTESVKLNRKIAHVAAEKDAVEALSTLEEAAGNPYEALSYLKHYITLNDSLFNQQKQEQITTVEGKLKYELKEEQVRNQQLLIDQQTSMLKRQNERIVYVLVLFAAIMLVLVLLISRYRMKRDKKAIELEQKQLETEHRLLRSQMNPHFMFNALNSIQAFISDNNTLQAELYLSKFARLMRYYLDSSNISFVSLEEEVNGLRMNIELEQLRLNFSFDFSIVFKEDLEADETEVPPMLAQPFVENAIKHGLRNKTDKGFLIVSFEPLENELMRCVIEDNGIGRSASARMTKANASTPHTSRGIEITKSRLQNIWKEKYRDDCLKIIDLNNEKNEATGTRVELLFPFRL